MTMAPAAPSSGRPSPARTGTTRRRARALSLACLASVARAPCAAAFAPSSPSRVPSRHGCRVRVPRARTSPLAALKAASASATSSRAKRTAGFTAWAQENDVKDANVRVASGEKNSGLGLYASAALKANDVVIQVPTKLTLSVEAPTDYNTVMERELFASDPKAYRTAPWWAALSVQLNYYDKVDPINERAGGVSMAPWMAALPRSYDTPLHWAAESLAELQYRPTAEAVALQRRAWQEQHAALAAASATFAAKVSYEDFVWGCETARSRAFSGAYSGAAFSPIPYATAAALVVAYLGLGLGTVEQAANGAAVVVCGSILKDFVLPKLLKVQKYVICPFIDMANHVGVGARGNVAFEYFADGFSLSALEPGVAKDAELCIQYGPRSNDQLLQYYGFVEEDNVHDVYILPPLREWDLGALEAACGRKVGPGRLEKLERAGLLGRATALATPQAKAEAANELGGVVLTRAAGLDPAVLQALRALVSSDAEWEDAGEAIGNFAIEASAENERAARSAARRALELELEGKPTTAEEDRELLRVLRAKAGVEVEEVLPVQFRLEKKKLLREAIGKLR